MWFKQIRANLTKGLFSDTTLGLSELSEVAYGELDICWTIGQVLTNDSFVHQKQHWTTVLV